MPTLEATYPIDGTAASQSSTLKPAPKRAAAAASSEAKPTIPVEVLTSAHDHFKKVLQFKLDLPKDAEELRRRGVKERNSFTKIKPGKWVLDLGEFAVGVGVTENWSIIMNDNFQIFHYGPQSGAPH